MSKPFTSVIHQKLVQINTCVHEECSSADIKYYIYKMEVNSVGRIRLKGVSDNITDVFGTSAEFRAFIAKYENLSFFFDKDEEKTFLKEN